MSRRLGGGLHRRRLDGAGQERWCRLCRRVRGERATVLTGIAIILGVAMISGTYILTDTIDRAFKQIFTESYAGTDAVVTGKGADISIDGEAVASPPVDEGLVETVRSVPEVALAAGSIVDDYGAKILTPDGAVRVVADPMSDVRLERPVGAPGWVVQIDG